MKNLGKILEFTSLATGVSSHRDDTSMGVANVAYNPPSPITLSWRPVGMPLWVAQRCEKYFLGSA